MQYDNIIALLQRRVDAATLTSVAEEFGISKQYLRQILDGTRPPAPAILRKLGLRRRTVYVKAGAEV